MRRTDVYAGTAASARRQKSDLWKRTWRPEIPASNDPVLRISDQPFEPVADGGAQQLAAIRVVGFQHVDEIWR
jgi:hypothetical protein